MNENTIKKLKEDFKKITFDGELMLAKDLRDIKKAKGDSVTFGKIIRQY